MKIRTGFVSNSSSSSFVCCICGRKEVGYDGTYEIDVFTCENHEHGMCCECKDASFQDKCLSMQEKREWLIELKRFDILCEYGTDDEECNIDEIIKNNKEEEMIIELNKLNELTDEQICGIFNADFYENMCPVCMMIEYDQSDLKQYLKKKTGYTEEEAFAEVKKLNKRRRKLYTSEYIMYACLKNNLNMDDIKLEIRNQFPIYNNFLKYLK